MVSTTLIKFKKMLDKKNGTYIIKQTNVYKTRRKKNE